MSYSSFYLLYIAALLYRCCGRMFNMCHSLTGNEDTCVVVHVNTFSIKSGGFGNTHVTP